MSVKVAVSKCEDYEEDRVEPAVRNSVELIGGLNRIIKPGNRVLLKVNLLAPRHPDDAVTTHPSVVRAVAKLVKGAGAVPIIADSPGFIYAGNKSKALIESGIKEAADELGVEAFQFESFENPFIETEIPGGVHLKSVFAARLALEADVIITLPKLKTHSNTLYTGAVKNMFGAVTSRTRRFAHTLATFEKFGGTLVDIYSLLKPRLAIMDAVIGMEGEGPRHGSPKEAGLILASYDSVALDAVASKIIGFDPMEIATTKLAAERGLGIGDLRQIEVVGENICDVSVDFEKPTIRRTGRIPFLVALFDRFSKVEPQLVEEKCSKCGICAKSCPVEAIRLSSYPKINRDICIECYCCNEMCPEGAMEIKKNWVIGLAR